MKSDILYKSLSSIKQRIEALMEADLSKDPQAYFEQSIEEHYYNLSPSIKNFFNKDTLTKNKTATALINKIETFLKLEKLDHPRLLRSLKKFYIGCKKDTIKYVVNHENTPKIKKTINMLEKIEEKLDEKIKRFENIENDRRRERRQKVEDENKKEAREKQFLRSRKANVRHNNRFVGQVFIAVGSLGLALASLMLLSNVGLSKMYNNFTTSLKSSFDKIAKSGNFLEILKEIILTPIKAMLNTLEAEKYPGTLIILSTSVVSITIGLFIYSENLD